MHDFVERITAYIHWAIFLLLEVLSGLLLFKYNSYQGSIWFTQANTAAAYVHEWEAKAFAYLRMPAENAELVQRNILLQHETDSLRHLLADALKDSSATEKKQNTLLQDIKLIPAHIVDNSVRNRDNLLVINAGSNAGVEPEMGVVSGTGVVGIVSAVTPHYSLVISILNSHSSISCRLRRTDYFGYLKWKGGNTLRAYMEDVPRHAHIKVGDIVETSGFSNVFPAGIFLGKVAKIKNSSDGLAYELEILLGTDMSNLRHVNVISNLNKKELDSLRLR
ncbi:MAG: rod shape-determining protein MreC [Bacteroidaceae bacterium]|nr:rod shape-determining protein MreC [Bacteroidaceae bacterium]MBO7168168.1 rod shape-determining protein MreC [Bacteroidaceae bacterium]MBQ2301490.1 rod shape-determining protein MreC [Bacteroidaceae bacterium]MBQ5621277.1 rod shape-determining protein MreC [Bacteroidaceae bacterium]MBR0544555.1 rod shape-determining protein MreC [Bacteroidaceae bacterium]